MRFRLSPPPILIPILSPILSSFLALCLLAAAAPSAFAFDRPFAPNAKRGEMTPDRYPTIVISGKTYRLAPGARIWNAANLIVMPASIRGSHVVNYTEDRSGAVDRVWMLTDAEAERPAPADRKSP